MNLLIMGPAGSGKGTMSEKIKQKYQLAHISTGDMLREAVKKQTALGLEALNYMNAGKLVPDTLINSMVDERIKQDDTKVGFLMDGFPRTLVQAEAFDEILQANNKNIDCVINLVVDFEVLADRITGRRLCKSCGSIYHIKNKPSKVEGVCDVCGNNLVQRSDDTVEQLEIRLQEHKKNTEPVLEYYRKQGLVVDIQAGKPVDEIFKDIERAIEQI
ncbi:MAG: adenylate kinase [Erysipelotrichaceae bacterium]|nr:adenylate kinase [Erysipelotrichaceae bacterium]MDO5084934.1 adenylate kinase [Erysipelotrichaceae bacterium]